MFRKRSTRLLSAVFIAAVFIIVLGQSRPANIENTRWEKLEWALEIFAKVAAGAGLIGIFYQFSREKELAEADFSLRLDMHFISNEHIRSIYDKLERSKVKIEQFKKEHKDHLSCDEYEEEYLSDEHIIDMANYLSFFGPFWELIESGLIDISAIDILSYRFFLATNNKFLQDNLLCKFEKQDVWRAIYLLHNEWRQYRKKKGLSVWEGLGDLSACSGFDEIIKGKSL